MNATSRRLYRGINALLLGIEASTHGYPLNRWLTYRQASELGGQVRRGERGTIVILWRLRKIAATADVYPEPKAPDLHERVIPLLRAFTVFNLAQIEGVPVAPQAVEQQNWEPEARAEELLLMSGQPFGMAAAGPTSNPATMQSSSRHRERSPMLGGTTRLRCTS